MSEPLTDEELDELREALSDAGAGPWEADHEECVVRAPRIGYLVGYIRHPRDRIHVAAADPHTVTRLLEEIDRLRQRVAELEGERETVPCPECDGEGGSMQRMGRDGACREYCECRFCDDELELTPAEIEHRRKVDRLEGLLCEKRVEIERLEDRIAELEGDDPDTWHASCDNCGWLHQHVSADRIVCECGEVLGREGGDE